MIPFQIQVDFYAQLVTVFLLSMGAPLFQPTLLDAQSNDYERPSVGKDVHSSHQRWRMRKEVDGIRVFYRRPSGSKILEVKTVMETRSSIPQILSVIYDIKEYPNWVYNCNEAYWLKRSTDSSGIYYCEIDFPWPIRNRDFIARTVLHRNPRDGTVEITIIGLPEYIPPKDKLVRMPKIQIDWVLAPLSGNRTHLEYKLRLDPGGKLPSWLINLEIDHGPLKTMQGLLEQL